MVAVDFETLDSMLKAHPELESPAFIQGLLAGMVCGDSQTSETDWIKRLLEEADTRSVKEGFLVALHALYGETLKGLNGDGFELDLCLPDEKVGLDWRARSLSQFCEGFLYGMGLTAGKSKALAGDPAELLEDFSQIAQLDTTELAETDDEDEANFVELVEFVKVGVLTIHETLNPAERKPIPMDAPPTDTLH